MNARPACIGIAALAVAASVLTACNSDTEEDPPTTRGIDARAYFEDYAESEPEDAGGGVNYSQSAPDATQAPERDTSGDVDVHQPTIEPPDPDEDNTFRDHGDNGFVWTADDDRSTFALDVDTGSYGVARTLLRDGYPVPKASVRVEEWVNAFEYDDPAPTDADLGLSTETGFAPSLDDGTQLVRVGVKAREVDPEDRPRVNVTLVVDRSGSMDIRERLGLVQSSLALLADRLDDDDTVSVVSFENEAVPILEPTKVSETDTILEAIEDLEPGGSTNLEAGLELGYQQARDAFDPDAVNLVVLASDGVANVGSTGPGSITETIAEEGDDGIHLVTVGYGMGNYNDHLMEQLANAGDGFYSYVDTYDEAEQLFGEDLVTTLTPVAADARTQVRFDPDVVSAYRLVGYENRDLADEDFTDASVDAGELGAGHHATALYEVRLADGVAPGAVIGRAAVRWTPTGPGGADPDAEQEEQTIDLTAADPDSDDPDDPTATLSLAATVADLAQVVGKARPYADRGLTLEEIRDRAVDLDDADVPGAAQLVTLTEQAIEVG